MSNEIETEASFTMPLPSLLVIPTVVSLLGAVILKSIRHTMPMVEICLILCLIIGIASSFFLWYSLEKLSSARPHTPEKERAKRRFDESIFMVLGSLIGLLIFLMTFLCSLA